MLFLITAFNDRDMASLSIVGHCWEFQIITVFFPWTKYLSFCNFYSLVLFIPSASQNKFLFHFATFIPISLQLTPFHIKEYQFLRPFLLWNGFLMFYNTLGYLSISWISHWRCGTRKWAQTIRCSCHLQLLFFFPATF